MAMQTSLASAPAHERTRRLLSDEAFAWALSALLCFATFANGAYDLWAATIVYLAAIALTGAFVVRAAWGRDGDGLDLSLLPLLGLCASVFGVSTLRAGNPAAAFQGYSDWCSALAVFWVSKHVFRGAGGTAAASAAAALIVWIELGVNINQQWFAYMPLREQMRGTLVNANFAACMILMWLPVLLAEAWRSRGERTVWFWSATVAAAIRRELDEAIERDRPRGLAK